MMLLLCRNNSYFGARNMFVGIDVAHAPPQSFADRIEGVPPSEPTVVGVSLKVEWLELVFSSLTRWEM